MSQLTLPRGLLATQPVRPDRSQTWLRRSAARRVPMAIVGFYLLVRLWQLMRLGPPILTPDTPMYRAVGQRWLDFARGNFTGHSLRPWPMTLLYSVAPTDTWRVVAQFSIATCCWAFCIWQFARLTPYRPVALIGSCMVALLALTLGVSGFDAVLLSESLTVSLVALYVGALLSVCTGRGRLPTLAAALVAGGLLAILRPVLLPLAPIVALVAYMVLLRPRPERRSRATATVLAFGVMSVGFMAYAVSYNVQIDRTWGDWQSVPGLNGRTLTQYYMAAFRTPSGPSLIDAMIDSEAPGCLRPDPPATASDASRDYFLEDRLTCPEGQAWLSEHYVASLATHLATHPGAARRYFAYALSDEALLRTDGRPSVPVVVPGLATDLFFSRRRGFGDPLVLWSVVAIVAFGAWWLRSRSRRSGPAGVSALQASMACTVLAAFGALVGTALLSALDASRVALPVTVLIRLVLFAVIARAVAGVVLSAKRVQTVPPADATAPPADATSPGDPPSVAERGADVSTPTGTPTTVPG